MEQHSDKELINLATANKLHESKVLKQQVDARCPTRVRKRWCKNFTGQWLKIRGITASERR